MDEPVQDLTSHICLVCLELYERQRRRGPLQRCRCRRDPDEERWPGHDFNERMRLCECCLREPLPSGSRWSVWFCKECKERVIAFNDELRFWLIPIGRHSFMARTYQGPPGFLGMPGRVALAAVRGDLAADREVERFADNMFALFGRVAGLHEWSKRRLSWYLEELGALDGPDPSVMDFGRALRRAAETDERFAKERAFLDLSESMLRSLSNGDGTIP